MGTVQCQTSCQTEMGTVQCQRAVRLITKAYEHYQLSPGNETAVSLLDQLALHLAAGTECAERT